jgi:hypothetical protein
MGVAAGRGCYWQEHEMSDRELLELAAKAAAMSGDVVTMFGGGFNFRQHGDDELWNPLTDDGDALRLAVKLGLHITPYPVYEEQKHSVVVLRNQDFVQQMRTPHNPTEVVEPYNADPYAATRRAIVRAAAEIGRAMK